jgi:hypothetical protein
VEEEAHLVSPRAVCSARLRGWNLVFWKGCNDDTHGVAIAFQHRAVGCMPSWGEGVVVGLGS